MDEPGYITMTRRQSNNQWNGGIASHTAPKILSVEIRWKSSRLDFLRSRWHPIIHYLPKAHTITSEYYSSLLVQLNDILKEKRRGKLTKVFLFLYDNAPAQLALASQKKLAYLGFEFLDHPPYSLDLAPSDYHLFPELNRKSKCRRFSMTRISLLPQRTRWTENIVFFF